MVSANHRRLSLSLLVLDAFFFTSFFDNDIFLALLASTPRKHRIGLSCYIKEHNLPSMHLSRFVAFPCLFQLVEIAIVGANHKHFALTYLLDIF
jgi:hypothetical protein